jgi:hypothetical protein
MLPLGADVTQLFQQLEITRKQLYECVLRINGLDKDGSEQAFEAFRKGLNAICIESERLSRESKLYASEFQAAETKIDKKV